MHYLFAFYRGLRRITAAFMKCLALLSGKGTVNIKSSVSEITAHTGTESGKEGIAPPAHM